MVSAGPPAAGLAPSVGAGDKRLVSDLRDKMLARLETLKWIILRIKKYDF